MFLELDIVPTKLSPVVVKHPFTDSGVVGIPGKAGELLMVNLLDDPEALQSWKELCRQQIKEADTPFKIALMITKPYQFAFLKYAAPVLSEQDLAHFLTHAWICTEEPNMSVKIYEGTGSSTLKKGVGHFEETSIWDGNVALAAHNRGVNDHFGEIHTLEIGDKVTLTTKLGTRTYKVVSVEKVNENDTSGLSPSSNDQVTMYTCVRNQRDNRWKVVAVAV